jgi:hypothetical protein
MVSVLVKMLRTGVNKLPSQHYDSKGDELEERMLTFHMKFNGKCYTASEMCLNFVKYTYGDAQDTTWQPFSVIPEE